VLKACFVSWRGDTAPSHCTGDEAIAMFRAAWGDDFIAGGCGAVIELP